MDLIELSRLLQNLIRLGTIAEVNHGARRCRVQTGELLTQWLPWFERRAGDVTTWSPPSIGEQCMIISPSGDISSGIVFVGLPSDLIDTPSHDPAVEKTQYPDGAVIEYNHSTHHLTVSGIATALVQASGQVVVDCPDAVFTGKVTVQGLLTYQNGLAGQAGENGSQVSGNFNHQGTFSNTGEMSSNGIIVDQHHHTGVQAGGAETGGPV